MTQPSGTRGEPDTARSLPPTDAGGMEGWRGLCAAYLQGGLNKLLDWPGAMAEAAHFGLPAPAFAAAGTIVTELVGPALVLSGRRLWFGALWLAAFTLAATFVANRSWELPPGQERFMTANAFFEHLGLVGGFLPVAWLEGRR